MIKNNPSIDIFLKLFFYGLLINPLLAYIYTVWIKFPDLLYRWFVMYILMIGILFILESRN